MSTKIDKWMKYKMKRKLLSIATLSFLIVSCGGGGGGGDSSPSGPAPIPPVLSELAGVYGNFEATAFIVVNGTSDSLSFTKQMNNGTIEIELGVKKVDETNFSSSSIRRGLSPDLGNIDITNIIQESNVFKFTQFKNHPDKLQVNLGVDIGSERYFDLNKIGPVAPLSVIAKSYLLDAGSEYIITKSGQFTINSNIGCLIEGNLKSTPSFYQIENAVAVSCTQPKHNGKYEGALFTVEHNGQTLVYFNLSNSTNVFWASPPLS